MRIIITTLLISLSAPIQLLASGGLPISSHYQSDNTKATASRCYIHLTTGILAGHNSDTISVYTPTYLASAGLLLSPSVALGVGSGLDKLELPTIPLFMEVRYAPFPKRVFPYSTLRAGYGLALERDWSRNRGHLYSSYYYYSPQDYEASGGLFLNALMGLAIYSWENVGVTIALGYRYQVATESMTEYNHLGGRVTREVKLRTQRVELQVGFLFR